MRGIDNPTGRVVAVLLLVAVLAAALRGYLPDARRAARDHTGGSPASLALVVAVLGAALGIIAVSLWVRVRERRAGAGAGDLSCLSEGTAGAARRPSWRVLAIGLAVILGWLLLMWLLSRWSGQHLVNPLEPGSGSPAPGDEHSPPDIAPQRQPHPSRRRPSAGALGYLAASTVGLLLLVAAGVAAGAVARRRVPRAAFGAVDPAAAPPAAADSLVRAAELGLAEIGDLRRDPRAAIIACYAAMERELARVPDAVPQEHDTPTEVLARAVEHHALPAQNATQLVQLFTEARFSPHVMTERHRQSAVDVLRLVLAELSGVA